MKANPTALTKVTLVEYLKQIEHPRDEVGQPKTFVLVFDQFEELLATHSDRWTNRKDFFEQIRQALDLDHLLRVVFILREEFIGEIDRYSHLLPDRPLARFRVEPLGAADALRAVSAPLTITGRRFAEGVAEKIISNLSEIRVESDDGETKVVQGEFIDPVQLQVVMQSLWATLPGDATLITENYLAEFGDLDVALSKFYERAVKMVASQTPEISEEMLRNWFENSLITPMGTRALVMRGENETGGMPNHVLDEVENWHLMTVQRMRGARWYELNHDRFIRPIQKSNKTFFQSRQ